MVAIALPTPPALDRSRRQLPSGGTGRGHLRLVADADRTARPIGAVLTALVLALAVVLAGAYLVRTPAPSPGSRTATHVAAEGDTMWSIAVAHAPAGDAARYVEALVEANGSARVSPGQAVTLPAG